MLPLSHLLCVQQCQCCCLLSALCQHLCLVHQQLTVLVSLTGRNLILNTAQTRHSSNVNSSDEAGGAPSASHCSSWEGWACADRQRLSVGVHNTGAPPRRTQARPAAPTCRLIMLHLGTPATHHCGLITAQDLHCHVMIAIQVVRHSPGHPVVAVVGAQLQQPVARLNKALNVTHLDLQHTIRTGQEGQPAAGMTTTSLASIVMATLTLVSHINKSLKVSMAVASQSPAKPPATAAV